MLSPIKPLKRARCCSTLLTKQTRATAQSADMQTIDTRQMSVAVTLLTRGTDPTHRRVADL